MLEKTLYICYFVDLLHFLTQSLVGKIEFNKTSDVIYATIALLFTFCLFLSIPKHTELVAVIWLLLLASEQIVEIFNNIYNKRKNDIKTILHEE